MDLNKHIEFFDPEKDLDNHIHIIGCGAIGSTLAEMLTRMGVPELTIYDMDIVTPHNLTNQEYLHRHIGKPKTESLQELLKEINPNIHITDKGEYTNQRLSGHIFLCVDNIDLRRNILKQNLQNQTIKTVFDFRMGLTDAQQYAAEWTPDGQEIILSTMDFTSEEAKAANPINACGMDLNVKQTVTSVVSLGLANFINFLKGKPLKRMILIDSFNQMLDAF